MDILASLGHTALWTGIGIVTLLVGLMFKHTLVDFCFQSNYLAQYKHQYGHLGGVIHALLHAGGTILVAISIILINISFPVYWVALAGLIDFLLHYHIDWAKASWVKHQGYSVNTRAFWVWFGIDQFLHFLTYLGLIAFLTWKMLILI